MTVVRLQTKDLPKPDRFAMWYEMTTRHHVPMIISSDHRDDFRATTELHDFGLMQLSRLSYAPLQGRRTEQLIRRSDPELLLVSLALRGSELTQLPDREWTTRPGGIGIFDTSRPATVINTVPLSRLVLQLPRSAIGARGPAVERLSIMSLPSGGGIGGVLAYILSDLARNALTHPPAVITQLSLTVVDLLTAAARIASGVREPAAPEAQWRVRQARIYRYVRMRLGDPGLTPQAIAEAHGISARQLSRDFQAEGSSPADWIRRQRLDRCRHDLLDAAQAECSVVEIGARWGFPDPTAFNRAFRREFGLPPGEYRRRHRGRADSAAELDRPRPGSGMSPDGD